jgi:hypothetical protein
LTEEEAEETVPLLSDTVNKKHNDYYEREPAGIKVGIKIRNLRKVFELTSKQSYQSMLHL